jgi:TusA-related sulfurtransferase
MDAQPDRTLDLRGKECPFTILEVGKALDTLRSGALIKVISDRDSIVEDLKAWCEARGEEFVRAASGDPIEVLLRKP